MKGENTCTSKMNGENITTSKMKGERKGKVPCLSLLTGFSSKLVFNLAGASYIIIVTMPPTVPDQDLNSGPLSLEESALLIELMRPDTLLKMKAKNTPFSKNEVKNTSTSKNEGKYTHF